MISIVHAVVAASGMGRLSHDNFVADGGRRLVQLRRGRVGGRDFTPSHPSDDHRHELSILSSSSIRPHQDTRFPSSSLLLLASSCTGIQMVDGIFVCRHIVTAYYLTVIAKRRARRLLCVVFAKIQGRKFLCWTPVKLLLVDDTCTYDTNAS